VNRGSDGGAQRYFGVYPAIVADIVDPDSVGRIQVKFPWLGSDGADVRAWATLITPYADDDQGYEMLPSVDTQVVVAFEAGDLRRPYIVGACWNASRVAARVARPVERQAADQEPCEEPARVRRHRGRVEGDALDAVRPQGRPRQLGAAGAANPLERLLRS